MEQIGSAGNNRKKSSRIEWVDCAKGIAICLVIVGHTVARGYWDPQDLVRGLIFTFHMPFFFICSGLTFRPSSNGEQLVARAEKSFVRMIVPAVSLYLFLRVYLLFRDGWDASVTPKQYVVDIINAIVYASGVKIDDLGIPAFGMLWFLVVMFLSRNLFDYLHLRLSEKWLAFACIALTIVGALFGRVQWLPLSFDLVLAVLAFFLFGYYLKRADIHRHMLLRSFLCLAVWIVTFLITYKYGGHYLELATREYPLYPLPYLTAAAGTMVLFYLGALLEKLKLSRPIAFIGRHTMIIYCVHTMDVVLMRFFLVSDNVAVNAALRLAVILCVSFLILGLITGVKKLLPPRKAAS